MNDCTIVIFGASGDLAKRKLFPAIHRLIAQKKITKIAVVGAAWEKVSAQEILDSAKPFRFLEDDEAWKQLQNCFSYMPLEFTRQEDYDQLAAIIKSVEEAKGLSGNRLIYLSAAAHFFCGITELTAKSGIATKKTKEMRPWNRLVYEKPFGHNLASAQKINECIESYFEEHQIYRIDHFLTKELVSNISLIRFTNAIFEPLWDHRYIEQVQISLAESMGIEGRGGYYDQYGALSDVVQNHMLELLALIGMEAPEKLTGELIRGERAKVLKDVTVVDGFLGQYEGYEQEKGVTVGSRTDTFAMLRLEVDNPRWRGVPFYLKTGKMLPKKETVIDIIFKPAECRLVHNCPPPSNVLTIEVSPEATFSVRLNVKKPGTADELVPVAMEFCHSCIFGAQTAEAYEVLFEELIRGEQSISVRFDEIEYAWNIIDTLHDMQLPVHTYKQQSEGPKEAIKQFEKKHTMEWLS